MKRIAKIPMIVISIVFVLSCTGCMRVYDKPEFAEIKPNETAVVIPLEGETSAQGKTPNAEFYEKNIVYSKRIQIPHKWIREGRMANTGRYVPTVNVIIVNNSPFVREWTDTSDTGTSPRNQAIVAESKESIGFKARMTATAQVKTEDVAKFLAWYHGRSMDDIMDTDIRDYASGVFAAQCAKRPLDSIQRGKGDIMQVVSDETRKAFAERGITISSLNLVGEFTYLDPSIQTAINKVFQAERDKQAMVLNNQKTIAEARAKAEAGRLLNGNGLELKKLELRQQALDNELAAIDAWKNGAKLPDVMGGNGMVFNIPR